MERFRPLMGRTVLRSRLEDPGLLGKAGLVPRYLPESFEDLDEMEFLCALEEDKRLVMSCALEEGRVVRIMFGWVAPEDPEDAMRSMDEEELKRILGLKGESLKAFLQEVTE